MTDVTGARELRRLTRYSLMKTIPMRRSMKKKSMRSDQFAVSCGVGGACMQMYGVQVGEMLEAGWMDVTIR